MAHPPRKPITPRPAPKRPPALKPPKPEYTDAYVKHLCEHQIPVRLLRAARCSACQGAARRARRRERTGRLPHGSVFTVRYDAETTSWSGTLTVPGLPPFASTACGVFGLLLRLDRQYRDSLTVGSTL
jgi:hypothetical protein